MEVLTNIIVFAMDNSIFHGAAKDVARDVARHEDVARDVARHEDVARDVARQEDVPWVGDVARHVA